MHKYLNSYVRVVDRVSDYVGIVAMYLIFLMVGILLVDAVTRNVLEIPLHWGIEAAQFTLAAYYFMGGAMTIKNDDHVRMDLFYGEFTPRKKDWMDLATIGCLLFYLVVMLIGSISSLQYAIETNETRFSMWNPSMIPIKILMVCCCVLMILQTISMIIKHITGLRGKEKVV
ncbi:C4-dicarboxylate ABC transporter permease ['Osedax' symbiont bacterium Rs2_46_30_T18]|nr:C4-dicarboxylate ABC transporter permease ['Osedax' symbiont bacterium Rs2_46_30_T18]